MVYNGTSITSIGATVVSLLNVENVTANLLGGTDVLDYGAATTADLVVNLATNSASGFSSISNVENVMTGAGNDTLSGDGGNNVLNGRAGIDTP